jgi:hypothetical protein
VSYSWCSKFTFSNDKLGIKWLGSLPGEHLDFIKYIGYDPLLSATTPARVRSEIRTIGPERAKLVRLKRIVKQATNGWEPERKGSRVRVRFQTDDGAKSGWTSDSVDTLLAFSGRGDVVRYC